MLQITNIFCFECLTMQFGNSQWLFRSDDNTFLQKRWCNTHFNINTCKRHKISPLVISTEDTISKMKSRSHSFSFVCVWFSVTCASTNIREKDCIHMTYYDKGTMADEYCYHLCAPGGGQRSECQKLCPGKSNFI